MSRKSLPVPSKEDLQKFSSRKEIAQFYDVSSYTVISWLKQRDLYEPKKGFGPHKLADNVHHIRWEHQHGATITELSEKYGVTFAAISRIVHNETYKVREEHGAIVSVIYNPDLQPK